MAENSDYENFVNLIKREAALDALLETLVAIQGDNSTNVSERHALQKAIVRAYNKIKNNKNS